MTVADALQAVVDAQRCPQAHCGDQGCYPVYTGGCDEDGENDTREVSAEQCEWCCTTPDSLFNRRAQLLDAHRAAVRAAYVDCCLILGMVWMEDEGAVIMARGLNVAEQFRAKAATL